jgi:tRNA(Ile)-lysidine synthase
MDNVVDRIAKTIDENRLLKRGDSVLVALSGGPDSVALLHLLDRLKSKYRIRLASAHLDHGIRTEALEERAFCRNLCRTLRIKFHSKGMNVLKFAEKERLTVEEAGRKARYEYFQYLCELFGYTRIATGHHSDDSVETILFNIARGSGLQGLSGISPRRGNIIRPLIEIGKKEILEWLKDQEIAYVLDVSNLSLEYARNRIRRKILPELEKLNPSARQNILRLARNAAEEIEFVDSTVVSAYEKALVKAGKSKIVLDLGVLKDYDWNVKKKVVSEAYGRLSGRFYRPPSKTISRAEDVFGGRNGAIAPLGRDIWIEKSQNRICVFRKDIRRKKFKLAIPGMTRIPYSDLYFDSKLLKRSQVKKLKTDPSVALLDNAKMKDVSIGYWKNGDRIRPFGMSGNKLLSDIFIDRKISSFERGEIPLVTSGSKIAWIAGVMISDDFKVGRGTKEILKIKLCGLS